jgi:hypothetical protein
VQVRILPNYRAKTKFIKANILSMEDNRQYWAEHTYMKKYNVYYCDDGRTIKTAFEGRNERECREWIKNQEKAILPVIGAPRNQAQ